MCMHISLRASPSACVRATAQVVFDPGDGACDAVCLLDEATLAAGGACGSLRVHHTSATGPIALASAPHGAGTPGWVSALSSTYGANLIVSGACDGFVRFWLAPAPGGGAGAGGARRGAAENGRPAAAAAAGGAKRAGDGTIPLVPAA